MALQGFDYRFSQRKQPPSKKPVALVGIPELKMLEAGEIVEYDAVTLIPAFDLKK
ncbi:hypothetical protein [Agrobacterium sp. CG674]